MREERVGMIGVIGMIGMAKDIIVHCASLLMRYFS